MSKKAKIIWGSVIVVVLAVLAIAYFGLRPKTQQGSKNITVQVVLADNTSKDFTISTDEEYLRKALESKNLIQGDESEYGLFVKTVDGVKADDTKEEWWCFTKGGETMMTSVDNTPIADGDKFEITLTTGY